jgi:hypothetical protein
MYYYREVLTNDPFRRSERERDSKYPDDASKGDLFGLRQRPRQLRILVDRESFSDPPTPDELEASRVLQALGQQDSVYVLSIDMSKVTDAGDNDETPDVVHLRDYTENKGWASLPGSFYGYRIYYSRGSTKVMDGNISPEPQLFQNLMGFAEEGGPQLEEVSAEEIQRHVLLTAAGRKVADLIISESPVAKRTDVAANYATNVFSRAEAIPIIAHYLRTQQIYHLDPVGNRYSNRKTFYHSAVYAMAPNICYWEAKTRYVPTSRYRTDCNEMIGRLIRALKAFDDLRFHLGALQTLDSYDDVADCVDRLLWSLCGAVDVLARSLHFALQLSGSERFAKLHGDEWYANKLRPHYAGTPGIANVDQAQSLLSTVFTLRNTIHYRALAAAGAVNDPAPYVGRDLGRIQLLIPADVYNQIDAQKRGRWGIEEVAPNAPVAADLATVASTALDVVFSFLDHLCGMLAFEAIDDKDEVLKLTEYTVVKDGRKTAARIRQLIGSRDIGSDGLQPVYPLE